MSGAVAARTDPRPSHLMRDATRVYHRASWSAVALAGNFGIFREKPPPNKLERLRDDGCEKLTRRDSPRCAPPPVPPAPPTIAGMLAGKLAATAGCVPSLEAPPAAATTGCCESRRLSSWSVSCALSCAVVSLSLSRSKMRSSNSSHSPWRAS